MNSIDVEELEENKQYLLKYSVTPFSCRYAKMTYVGKYEDDDDDEDEDDNVKDIVWCFRTYQPYNGYRTIRHSLGGEIWYEYQLKRKNNMFYVYEMFNSCANSHSSSAVFTSFYKDVTQEMKFIERWYTVKEEYLIFSLKSFRLI